VSSDCITTWRKRLVAVAAGLIFALSSACAAEVSFRRDVMAVLSKAGCNAGPCHGNANGKGGFRLSLRGDDPDFDFAALTRDQSGRRVNLIEPGQSLLLLKPTTAMAHEGGKRFELTSWEATTLLDWISRGATNDGLAAPQLTGLEVTPAEQVLVEPADSISIKVAAVFADGARRDVTREAVYETSNQNAKVSADGRATRTVFGETTVLVRYLQRQQPVRLAFVPARPDFKWARPKPANFVDEHIFAKLKALRTNPSGICTDEVFCRRAHLDLLGLLPTADEAARFLADRRRDKRAHLIDTLLERPEFADYWAVKWDDLLRVEERTLDRKGMEMFHRWIRDSVAANKPLDQFCRELLAARGSTYVNPPANFWRAVRDPVTRAETVAQVFLGRRVQCAQCHNHPFDRWTQDDYWDWAAVFAKVNYKVLRNDRRDDNDKHEFKGEQVVFLARDAEVKNPRRDKAARPRMLSEAEPMALETGTLTDAAVTPSLSAHRMKGEGGRRAGEGPPPLDELTGLAAWLTSSENPFFARAQVNRIWFHLMGRGLVDPIDDFRPTNPASHPALLEALATDFVGHGFDLRHAIRVIMNSRTYQLDSEPNVTNRDDELNYSHVSVRRLSAEQLFDAEHQVCGVTPRLKGWPDGTRAGQLPGTHTERVRGQKLASADRFLEVFGKPPRLLACECERSTDSTMSQAFQLISGPLMNDLLTAKDNRLARLAASGKSSRQLAEELYWTALTRSPSVTERDRATQLIPETGDRRPALEDLTWGLLNAKEFVLRR
jgi:hypothetical protein